MVGFDPAVHAGEIDLPFLTDMEGLSSLNIYLNIEYLLYVNIIHLVYFNLHAMTIYLVTMHGKQRIFTVSAELFNAESDARGQGQYLYCD